MAWELTNKKKAVLTLKGNVTTTELATAARELANMMGEVDLEIEYERRDYLTVVTIIAEQ